MIGPSQTHPVRIIAGIEVDQLPIKGDRFLKSLRLQAFFNECPIALGFFFILHGKRPLKNGFATSQKSFPLRERPDVIMIHDKPKTSSLERRKTFDSPLANHFSAVMQSPKRGAARRTPCMSATAAGRSATAASRQAGRQFETGPPAGLDEVHINRFNFFQKFLIDQKGDPSVRKDLVISL
jgi:hypothetical protein